MNKDEKPKLKMPPKVRFLSVPETAFIMEVSSEQVRNWIQEGRLRAYRVGTTNNLTRIRCNKRILRINRLSQNMVQRA